MSVGGDTFSDLERDRREIARAGTMHLFHWVVVLFSLVLTVIAWSFAKWQVEERATSRFNSAASQVVELVAERMEKYEDGLWGGVSAIQANGGAMSYREWRAFAGTLRIDEKYPGINGIGVIHYVPPERLAAYLAEQRRDRPGYRIHPTHARRDFLPITYIEPGDANAQAVGLDMAHEDNRYAAALRARDDGVAQITGPIVLVQDQTRTPGFLFYAPYYRGGVQDTIAERRARFEGLVYAPFVFDKLMEGLLGKDRREIRFRVRDGAEVLYDEHRDNHDDDEGASSFSTTAKLDIYGRRWEFDIWATRGFAATVSSDQPTVILLGGIVFDTLLLTILYVMSRANRRAVGLADRMTRELRAKADDLERSNSELETFAYVAAHDLRAPLRGIGDLSEYRCWPTCWETRSSTITIATA